MNQLRHLRGRFSHGVSTLRWTNYNQFRAQVDSFTAQRYEYDNQKALRDIQQIQQHKRNLALKEWKLNQENNNYNLNRVFHFESSNKVIAFMNVVKAKSEELDHHPEWTLQGDNLIVNLTSHSAHNNVTPVDFELALFMNQEYEHRDTYKYKYNNFYQTLISNSTAAFLTVVTVSIVWFFFQVEKNYRIQHNDFLFAKINFDSNDYNNERKLRRLEN